MDYASEASDIEKSKGLVTDIKPEFCSIKATSNIHNIIRLNDAPIRVLYMTFIKVNLECN